MVHKIAIVVSHTYVFSCGLVLLQSIVTDVCIMSFFSSKTCKMIYL